MRDERSRCRARGLRRCAGRARCGDGLVDRLNSHAYGRRSGDEFNVYVWDRCVVPAVTPGEQPQIADGRRVLDQMTGSLIREHLGYRYAIHPDGTTALAAKRAVRARQPGGREAVPQPAVTAVAVTHNEIPRLATEQ